MATDHPPPLIHSPAPPHAHKTTLILLHGTSQTGPELASILLPFPIPCHPTASPITTKTLPELLPNTKFVFPTGARKETTVFGGKETNSWFDIHTFSDRTVGEKDQIPGLSESISYLSTLIKEQVEELIKVGVERGEARKRIVVGGFSSGAALAVLGRLSGEWEIGGGIGGFVGMSGWLPFRAQIDQLPSEVAGGEGRKGKVRGYLRELLSLDGEGKESEVEKVERGERMKVLLCHGEKDVKVKYEWALQMRKTLEGIGAKVQWRSYEGLEHWVCGEEMSDVVAFLRQV